MFSSLLFTFITLFLHTVCFAENDRNVQEGLAVQDVESKIANLDYFLLVFCEDMKDEECQDLTAEIDSLVKENQTFAGLEAAVINYPELIKKYGIDDFPSLVFFRKSDPVFYADTETDSASIYLWMEHHRESHIITLNDKNFEHDTQATTGATTGDWFIMFYNTKCSHLLGIWETIAGWLQQTKVVAKVELSSNPGIMKRFQFKDCPTIALLSQGKMYIYKGDLTNLEHLASFARSNYRDVEAAVIPPEPSSGFPFLDLIQMDSMIVRIALFGGITLVVLLIVTVIIIIAKRHKQRSKLE